MIKIEFPDNNKKLAGALGRALSEYSASANCASVTVKVDASEALEQIKQAAEERENDLIQTVETATEQASSTETSAGATASGSFDTRVDPKGVNFNAEFCGEAQVPFYASGKNKGQWKKKKGVEEVDYQQWYTGALLSAVDKHETALDTSCAFGGQQQTTEQKPVPKDCGEFMGWVSSQQAAGHLNQNDITEAYATLNLQVTDLFAPNPDATIEQHVRNLHACLGGLE